MTEARPNHYSTVKYDLWQTQKEVKKDIRKTCLHILALLQIILEYTDWSTQRECCFGHDGLALWARKSFSGEVIAFIRPAAIMEKRSKWA